MGRFDYLAERGKQDEKKAGKAGKKKASKKTPAPDGRRRGESEERVEAVYVRKETVRAVWRQVKKEGGESVSELVEDLLLRWLRGRA
ncbi:hypothetical protein SAMN04488058_10369 [Deinococcus reticulitermitis]|uniref:Uncharacterized protein n=1 Tax=Deinococcus reticulitermitis TaxID=856736 RepID=A0A1H6VEN4_9DEIO|nr:hypothetical protein [Deinococcus reticulitermitis]SEJ00287.1 hypothetical protein SAMN04488058_10369 [Deinococcus reticulitermitis]